MIRLLLRAIAHVLEEVPLTGGDCPDGVTYDISEHCFRCPHTGVKLHVDAIQVFGWHRMLSACSVAFKGEYAGRERSRDPRMKGIENG